jgi:glycosyltransferase involved in cell wall biosynthesis
MSEPITVLIPCKNEIDNISACIASARRLGSEVLVSDSGSTDGTLEIANQLADRVIEREYVNSGDFKNWAIPQAKHSWVLILDADERITPEFAAEVKAQLIRNENLLAYSVPRRNFILGHPIDHGDWSYDCVIRLIHRDHCRYKLHTDHAEINVPVDRLGWIQEKLVHYTAWDLDAYIAKMQHYAEQQATLWHSRGKRPTLAHVVLNAPLRFLRGYVLRFGFLDGAIGFHVASLTAYYSFLKQFLLWQKCFGRTLAEFEPDYAADRFGVLASNDDAKAA